MLMVLLVRNLNYFSQYFIMIGSKNDATLSCFVYDEKFQGWKLILKYYHTIQHQPLVNFDVTDLRTSWISQPFVTFEGEHCTVIST